MLRPVSRACLIRVRSSRSYDGNGALLAANDNWKTNQRTQIEATNIPPTDDAESAIVLDLSPGLYTAIVAGKGTSGIDSIEVYNLP